MSNEVVVDEFELESFLAELDEESKKLLAEEASQSTPVASAPVAQPTPVQTVAAQPEPAVQASAPVSKPSVIDPADLPDVGVETTKAVDVGSIPSPQEARTANLADFFKSQKTKFESTTEADAPVIEDAPVAAAPAPTPEPAPTPTPQPEIPAAPIPEPEPAKVAQSLPVPDEKPAAVGNTPSGLQHFIDINQFRRDIRVNEVNLDAAMFEQSGLRAFYGANAAYAEAQHSRLKNQFEVLEAQLFDHHRKALAASGEKVTEKMVESAVKTDKRWLGGKNKVIEAETIASIAKTCVSALMDRRDMIIQIGADRRDEGKGALRVLAKQEAERNSDAAAQAAIRQAFSR